jgi:S-adenosylmethionine:tRNA-ribosyltransferase-isomerase (queuine synthetase)
MWIETTRGELINLEHVEAINIKAIEDDALMRVEARTTSGAQITLITAAEIKNKIKKHVLEDHSMHDILKDVFDNLINLINSRGKEVIKVHICVEDICDL